MDRRLQKQPEGEKVTYSGQEKPEASGTGLTQSSESKHVVGQTVR